MQPHRRQPIRLHRPWDSPGKNTGVGCQFLLQCMKVKSKSEVAQLCPALSNTMDCSPPGSSIDGFSRQEYWSGLPLPSPYGYIICWFFFCSMGTFTFPLLDLFFISKCWGNSGYGPQIFVLLSTLSFQIHSFRSLVLITTWTMVVCISLLQPANRPVNTATSVSTKLRLNLL